MTAPRRAGRRAGPARRLLVFGRWPEAGRTKTRLAPLLGERGAAELYRAFLDDTLRAARAVPDAAVELWVPRRPGAEALAERYPRVRLRWQASGDLGARLRAAFEAAFAEGADHVLITGSDHPSLPAALLGHGLDALGSAPLVLGPSLDGGYYAVGLRRTAWPDTAVLFRDIPWSTPDVLARTRRRAESAGLTRIELPDWYDVDEPEDLARLRADLPLDSRTARALAGRARVAAPGGEGVREEDG